MSTLLCITNYTTALTIVTARLNATTTFYCILQEFHVCIYFSITEMSCCTVTVHCHSNSTVQSVCCSVAVLCRHISTASYSNSALGFALIELVLVLISITDRSPVQSSLLNGSEVEIRGSTLLIRTDCVVQIWLTFTSKWNAHFWSELMCTYRNGLLLNWNVLIDWWLLYCW